MCLRRVRFRALGRKKVSWHMDEYVGTWLEIVACWAIGYGAKRRTYTVGSMVIIDIL